MTVSRCALRAVGVGLLACWLVAGCEQAESAPHAPAAMRDGSTSGGSRPTGGKQDAAHDDGSDAGDSDAGAAHAPEACTVRPSRVTPELSSCGAKLAAPACRFAVAPDVGPRGDGLVVVDLDRDGRDDVLSTSSSSGGPYALLSGSRGLADACTTGGLDMPVRDALASAGDLDGDGDLELVRSGCTGSECLLRGRLEVYDGTARGALERLEDFVSLELEDSVGRAVVIDLEDDGRAEVVAAFGGTLLVLERDGDALTVRTRYVLAVQADVLHAVDFEGDGDLDVVGTSFDGARAGATPLTLEVIFNDGGRLGPLASTAFMDAFAIEPRASFVDFDGDAVIDIALAAGLMAGSPDGAGRGVLLLRGLPSGELDRVGTVETALESTAYAGAGPDCESHYLAVKAGSSIALYRVTSGLGVELVLEQAPEPAITGELLSGDFDGDGTLELLALGGDSGAGLSVLAPTDCEP